MDNGTYTPVPAGYGGVDAEKSELRRRIAELEDENAHLRKKNEGMKRDIEGHARETTERGELADKLREAVVEFRALVNRL